MVGIPTRGFRRAGAPPPCALARRQHRHHRRAAFAALLALGAPEALGAQRAEPVGARRPAAAPSVGAAVTSAAGAAAPPLVRTRLAVAGAGPAPPRAPGALLPQVARDGRRRKGPYLWGGAAVGAVATGLALVVEARQDEGDYDDFGAYAVVPAMAAGAALGAGVGYLVYRVAVP